MSTTERKLDFRDKRRETEQIKSAHEKGGPALSQASFFAPLGRKPRISQVRRPKSNQSNDARSTTQQNPIDLSAQSLRASPIDLSAQSLRASPIDYATHSTTQPSPTGRTTQSIMQLSPTKRTAQPAPRRSSIAHAVPSATRSTRHRRPRSQHGAAGPTAHAAPPATRPGTART